MPRKRLTFEDKVRANIARLEQQKVSALKEADRCTQGIAENKIALRIYQEEQSKDGEKTQARRPGNRLPEQDEKGQKESMSALIKRVALAHTGRYAPDDIKQIVRREYPLVFTKMPRNYVATTLWKFADQTRRITLVKRGGNGTPGEYETPRPAHATAA